MPDAQQWKEIKKVLSYIKASISEAEELDKGWSMQVERHLVQSAPVDMGRVRQDAGVRMVCFFFEPGVDLKKSEEKAKVCSVCGR